MMTINVLHWFINFLIKKISVGGSKTENVSSN